MADPAATNGAPSQALVADTAEPIDVIRQQAQDQDYLVLRFAVLGLILAVLVSLVSVTILAVQQKQLPDGVLAIGSAGVGALATMLVRPPSAK